MINKIFNTKDKKKLLTNFIALSSIQGLNIILPLITMPYLFKVLGVEKFGLIAFSYSLITFFNVIVDYGFELSGTRDVALNKNDKKELIKIYSRIQLSKFILLIFSFILLSSLILSFDRFAQEWQLYYLTFLFVIGNTIFPVWLFQGIEEMKYISYLNLFSKLFFTISIFIFIQTPEDYLYQPLLNGLGIICIGTYSIYFIKKKYSISIELQPLSDIYKTLSDSWNIFLTSLLPNLYNNFSTFFLGLISSVENVAYYSLATRIVDVAGSITQIIRNVTFPYLNNKKEKFNLIAKISLVVGLVVSFFILFLTYPIVPLIFGEKANESLIYIYILSFTPLLLSISYTYGVNKLLIHKKDKEYRNITFKFSIIGFLGALVLIPFFGALGASINLLFTRILMAYFTYQKSKGLI